MNVYKYRFDLGDSVSRPTPWPTPSLLHQLPLAQEEAPRKQGKERSRTPSPEPPLGPGRIRQRAWEALSLLKGLESGGASAYSLPQWASWTDPFLLASPTTSQPPSPRSLQTSPSLPPSPSALTRSALAHMLRLDSMLWMCVCCDGPCPLPSLLTLPSHPLSPASCSTLSLG